MYVKWDLTTKEVRSWLGGFAIPEFGVHILMDRCVEVTSQIYSNSGNSNSNNGGSRSTLGKTMPDAFVEFESAVALRECLLRNKKVSLKGRPVSVERSSVQELMRSLFPNWGMFKPESSTSNAADIINNGSSPPSSSSSSQNRTYLTRAEISALVSVCKNYKLHFSRKCADRAFENITSIITHLPWTHPLISPSTLHRDHIFEMLKVAMDALKMHLTKEYHHVSTDLLASMVRCGFMCPGFTERQKMVLLSAAGIDECPSDLVPYLELSASGSARQPALGDTSIISTSVGGGLQEDTIDKSFQTSNSAGFDGDGDSCSSIAGGDSSFLVEHERDIMNYYQKELNRWKQKYRALDEKYAVALQQLQSFK